MDLYLIRSISICRECYVEIKNILKTGVHINPYLKRCNLLEEEEHYYNHTFEVPINSKYINAENPVLKLTNDSRRFLLKEIGRF